MGIVESLRGVMWARHRQPEEVAYGVALGHERFSPSQLIERRPPVYMSALGPQAAEIAGRLADGIWTLADPQKAPAVIASSRRSAEAAGREPGEIIVQGMASWAEDDEDALEGAREWNRSGGHAAHLWRACPAQAPRGLTARAGLHAVWARAIAPSTPARSPSCGGTRYSWTRSSSSGVRR